MRYKRRIEPSFEASQWHKPGDHPAVDRKMLAEGGRSEYGLISRENMIVVPGDWVLTLPSGRHQVLRDSEFHKTYEPVEE